MTIGATDGDGAIIGLGILIFDTGPVGSQRAVILFEPAGKGAMLRGGASPLKVIKLQGNPQPLFCREDDQLLPGLLDLFFEIHVKRVQFLIGTGGIVVE